MHYKERLASILFAAVFLAAAWDLETVKHRYNEKDAPVILILSREQVIASICVGCSVGSFFKAFRRNPKPKPKPKANSPLGK